MLFYPLLLNSYCFSCKLFGAVTSYFEFVQGAGFQLGFVSTGKKEKTTNKNMFLKGGGITKSLRSSANEKWNMFHILFGLWSIQLKW